MTGRQTAVLHNQAAPRAHLFGASVAMVTPFNESGAVDLPRLATHTASVMAAGASGVTLFGTTGEGASLGPSDRAAMLGAALGTGIAPKAVTVCVTASDLETAEAQARMAFSHGVTRLLLAPPFYFKALGDEPLHRWFASLVDRIGAADPRIILYHIPQITGIALGAPLVRRLKDSCGEAIFGVKDSEGSWDHVASLLPFDDLAILIGDERLLARAAPLGGAGAISGMANIVPALLQDVIAGKGDSPDLNALVDKIVLHPVTPLVKALVGAVRGEEGWQRTRAPLSPSDPAVVASIAPRMKELATRLTI